MHGGARERTGARPTVRDDRTKNWKVIVTQAAKEARLLLAASSSAARGGRGVAARKAEEVLFVASNRGSSDLRPLACRTLMDWLTDRRAAGKWHSDTRRGHTALPGRHLLAAPRPLPAYGGTMVP